VGRGKQRRAVHSGQGKAGSPGPTALAKDKPRELPKFGAGRGGGGGEEGWADTKSGETLKKQTCVGNEASRRRDSPASQELSATCR